jgi:SAM-dependent methyltransferase
MSLWHRLIHPITAHFRRKRGDYLLAQFPDLGAYKILDLGGSIHFWEKVNLPVVPANVVILNVSTGDSGSRDETRGSAYEVRLYDGRTIPFADREFDLLICNSVIEHVPPADRAPLVAEIIRVSKRVFLQTPAAEFPFEPHFLLPFVHWLPRRMGFLVIKLSPWRILARPSAAEIHNYWWGTRLLSKGGLQRLLPMMDIRSERVCGVTKSYYALYSSVLAAHPRDA